MKNKDFDDKIKKSLKDLNQDVRKPNWKVFDQILENEDIKDIKFDAKINDKLATPNELIKPPKGGFESILATIEAENQNFDNQIINKLNTLPEGHSRQAQWNDFHEMLTQTVKVQEDVIKYKASELIAFLLLVTFINYAFFSSTQHNNQSSNETLQYAESTRLFEELDNELDSKIKVLTPTVQDKNNHSTSLEDDFQSAESLTSLSNISEDQTSMAIAKELPVEFSKEFASPRSSSTVETNLMDSKPLDLANIYTNTTSQGTSDIAADITSDILPENNANSNMELQNSLLTGFNTLKPISTLSQNTPSLLAIPTENIKSWQERIQIGAYVGAKRNHIEISKDKSVLERDRHIKSYTMGVGTKATYKDQRWLASVGLEYFNMDYYLSASSLSGSNIEYTRTSLDYIKYEFLHVPIDIKYAIYEDAKNSIFASAGMGINFLIASEYIIIEQNAFSPNTILVDPDAINENSTFADLDYQDGLLESEDKFSLLSRLRNSIYSKLRFGMGYERKLNLKSSIFCDLIWDYQLNKNKGIGPMQDNINHYSLNVGINYRLG